MSTVYLQWLLSLVVPESNWMIHACTQEILSILWELDITYWIWMINKLPNFFKRIHGWFKLILGYFFIFRTYKERPGFSFNFSNCATTICNVRNDILILPLVFDCSKVFFSAQNKNISLKSSGHQVWVIFEEIAW